MMELALEVEIKVYHLQLFLALLCLKLLLIWMLVQPLVRDRLLISRCA